ncbi:hypothetical protein [Microbacterium sp.]|nr:hypothetical protein [Microbacterium sp.]
MDPVVSLAEYRRQRRDQEPAQKPLQPVPPLSTYLPDDDGPWGGDAA